MTDIQNETTDAPAQPQDGKAKKRAGGISGMLLPELKSLAGALGIKGAGSMKKAQLLDAIKAHQASQPKRPEAKQPEAAPEKREPKQPEAKQPEAKQPEAKQPEATQQESAPVKREPQKREPEKREPEAQEQQVVRERRRAREGQRSEPTTQVERADDPEKPEGKAQDRAEDRGAAQQGRQQGQPRNQQTQQTQTQTQQSRQGGQQGGQQGAQQGGGQGGQSQQRGQGQQQNQQQSQRQNQQQQSQQQQNQQDDHDDLDDDGEGGRRNRRRRGRDRDRTRSGGRNEPDTTILEDDVLVPAAGILDVLDNYAFVRTSGYLAGADDVYLSLSMVRKYALRRGDAIVGQVRQPREGERKEKFNPMVRIDSVNGADPDAAKHRVDFTHLTPVHPQQRLRFESGPDNLIGRVVDIVTPVGKGQRGLIVAPAQAGKTTILQSMATSVTTNNPECHLMVVLIDARPEEVTDFERSVKGEVIASAFDQAPGDHTTVAELAVERAKRLVELGHDVVVLIDGLSRLGRAYNVAGPSWGWNLAGGVDASAVTAIKRLFGAARTLENGGSLTILATTLVESGSAVDELLIEELTGTESLVLRLDGDLADDGVFPAVDLVQSGTRHEGQLVGDQEHAVLEKLRRGLTAERGAGLPGLLERLRKTQTNYELLGATQRSA